MVISDILSMKIKTKKRDGKISELDLTYSSESHKDTMCSRSSQDYVSGWLTTYVI